jgi:hypothetical protein
VLAGAADRLLSRAGGVEAVEVARVAVVAPSTSESVLKTAACSAWYPPQGYLDVLVWFLWWGGRVRGSGRE